MADRYPRTPLTDLERRIIAKLVSASFPSYSACKRFARDLAAGHIQELSDKGRAFLAFVVQRFRRQYTLDPEEQAYVALWLNRGDEMRQPPAPIYACGMQPEAPPAPIYACGMQPEAPPASGQGKLFAEAAR